MLQNINSDQVPFLHSHLFLPGYPSDLYHAKWTPQIEKAVETKIKSKKDVLIAKPRATTQGTILMAITSITCQLVASSLSVPWNKLMGNDCLDSYFSSIIISISRIILTSKIQSTYCHQLDTKHCTCYYSHSPTCWFKLQHLLVRWVVTQILMAVSVTF